MLRIGPYTRKEAWLAGLVESYGGIKIFRSHAVLAGEVNDFLNSLRLDAESRPHARQLTSSWHEASIACRALSISK